MRQPVSGKDSGFERVTMTTSVFRVAFEFYENKGLGFVFSWSPWKCTACRLHRLPLFLGAFVFLLRSGDAAQRWVVISCLPLASWTQQEPAHICETRYVFSKTAGSLLAGLSPSACVYCSLNTGSNSGKKHFVHWNTLPLCLCPPSLSIVPFSGHSMLFVT